MQTTKNHADSNNNVNVFLLPHVTDQYITVHNFTHDYRVLLRHINDDWIECWLVELVAVSQSRVQR